MKGMEKQEKKREEANVLERKADRPSSSNDVHVFFRFFSTLRSSAMQTQLFVHLIRHR